MKDNRLRTVIGYMEDLGLKQLIITDPNSVYYLTGHSSSTGERLYALLIKDDGSADLFINQMFVQPEIAGLRVHYHQDNDDNLVQLAAAVLPGKLGVDKLWAARFLLGLLEKRPDLQPVLGSAAVDLARKFKDAEEIDLMRWASAVNDATVGDVIGSVDPGLSERQMVGVVGNLHVQHGADAAVEQLICYGANCAEPHHESDHTMLQPGDSIIFDIFTPVKRYWCDMTRTVFYQSVTEEQRCVYELVREANAAGIAAVKPGARMCDIDAAARQVIEAGGYGPYFTHRLGHGIGLDIHEPPDCSSANQGLVEPGMCFSIEPGVYLPGCFGVRIEDLVVVTESGVEVLNKFSKDLQVIG